MKVITGLRWWWVVNTPSEQPNILSQYDLLWQHFNLHSRDISCTKSEFHEIWLAFHLFGTNQIRNVTWKRSFIYFTPILLLLKKQIRVFSNSLVIINKKLLLWTYYIINCYCYFFPLEINLDHDVTEDCHVCFLKLYCLESGALWFKGF